MTHTIPDMTAHTITAMGTIIDQMLQRRVPVFQITYMEKKRIAEPIALISELLHGVTDPHYHAITQYQVSTTVYQTKTVLLLNIDYHEDSSQLGYVNKKVQEIISTIVHSSMHVHQKLLAIHEWITANVRYDHTLRRRTAYDALYHASTVCSGYASLCWHLCHAAGIPCRIVTGVGKFEAHAWNMVQIEDSWYHIDTTWCTVADTYTPFSVYRFYLLTDKEIQHTHRITLQNGQKPLPYADKQYRVHLQRASQTTPQLRRMIDEIMRKTGLIYLEPEYMVEGIQQLSKRIQLALQKKQPRILFGYRGATQSAQQDIRDVLSEIKAFQTYSVAININLYPMPHGFIADSVLIDIHLEYQ